MRSLIFIVLGTAFFIMARYFYFKPDYVYGEQLPDINVELYDGRSFTSGDMNGHLVLVDFWGSWCGPCRKEAPELVRLYRDYADKTFDNGGSFRIFSVGVEGNRERWLSAIRKDGLDWPWHYSALQQFDGPLEKEFGVREIPKKFLIDENGMVVGVDPSFAEIRDYLDQRLEN